MERKIYGQGSSKIFGIGLGRTGTNSLAAAMAIQWGKE